MKKAYKVLSVLMIAIMVLTSVSTVFATNVLDKMTGEDSDVDVGTIGDIGNKILVIVTNVGMVLAIVLVAILGIKYMMGSTEEKAEYKKSMIPYLVGAILVFGAAAIGKAVINFGQQITV